MAKTIAQRIWLQFSPGAWIVNPKDKGRKSIKNSEGHRSESTCGKVYLQNDEEFEIELFNPLKVSVLADIKLNGQSISKTGLVVKPGQRIYLDCFIDDKKKFIFKTYEIENTEVSLEATSDNGLLEVFFYKEDVVSIKDWKRRFDRVIVEKWYPVYYPTYPTYQPFTVWCSNPSSYNLTNTGGIGTTTNVNYSDLKGSIGTYTTTNGDIFNNTTGTITTNSASIETGRIEKGGVSSQKFTEVDMDFETNYIASTIIQLLPESIKPAEIKEIKGSLNKVMAKDILKRESGEIIELIKKLGELHSAGILTDDEFSTKKAELLSKI
jgi:hypothetical protein